MKQSIARRKLGVPEILLSLLVAMMLLLLVGTIVKGQGNSPAIKSAKAPAQIQQPLYREYRGVTLGMTAVEVRAKLGEPAMKSDQQDFYVLSTDETTQIVYNAAQKVVTISTDYTRGVGAPDYKSVVVEPLIPRPDGSSFRMVFYDSERFWVSYNKSAGVVPVVTVTVAVMK
jgi:hypothetical protein